ncbi:MAG TPA: hypothetical protein VFM80_05645 [Gracilimonas sp.]|uniref:hypothetical protein n=1 Tax=Gracilimonas sp. TaxID=1974203 RepID=UPI002D8C01FA|nr:hypothetical protein [Gracilimonas sp.]
MNVTSNISFKTLYYLVPALLVIILISCNPENEEIQKIDYASLDEIELELELKITDSENFAASNLNGFYATKDGNLLITERSGPGIHQFNSEGDYVKRVARDGRGPGELSPWFHSHFNGETLIATNNPGYNAAIFQQDEDGIFQYVKAMNQRYPGSFYGFRAENDLNSFYSSENKAMQSLQVPPEFTYSNIHIIDLKNDTVAVRDSINSLRVHSDFVEDLDGRGIRITKLPYRYSDTFQPLPGGKFLIARPEKGTINIYNSELNIEHELELNVSDRLVSSEDLEYHIGDYDASTQEKMSELISDIKPPFMDVKMDDSNRFWLWTDETERGLEYVILSYEGEPLGKVYLPSGEKIEIISDNRLFVISEPDDDIPSAIVYRVDI